MTKEELIKYINEVLLVKPWQFSRWSKENNPLPIGTRAAYRICLGKEVSKSQMLLIQDFLKKHNESNTTKHKRIL